MIVKILLLASLVTTLADDALPLAPGDVPRGDEVKVDTTRGEIRFAAQVQHPKGKPCIDDFGQRIQAFVGSAKAGGGPSQFVDYFVFSTNPSRQ